ncbi:MAG: putative metal-dependent hydrolase [Cyclobacteriaceae bacterium]|nr:putative metal-dependent hydrolase [Cyclobacteriaceae bacterium]
MTDIENLKFPVGKLSFPTSISKDTIKECIETISSLPEKVNKVVKDLNENQLQYKYRPEGWNILQVVHHLADSHMNSFIRFKLTLTEDSPTIKPYFEARWSEMPDVLQTPIESSLKILEGVHQRWTVLLNNMSENDFSKLYVHPEHGRTFTLDQNVFLYAWHCRHHLAHIDQALEHKF